jgi:homopolymeric O-antigen transport system permease protein
MAADLSMTETPAAIAPPRPTPRLSIRPPKGWTAINLREIWQFRDLLRSLVGRDLKVRYKQTALGVIWVVLQPLMAAGVFSVVFGKIFKAPSDGVPYFIFAYTGMLAWNFFSNVLSRSSACLIGNAHLISKVFFPRLVLPLSTVGSAFVDYLVAALLLVVLLPVYHVTPGWALLLLPVWTVALLMMALGIGLFCAALTVSYRDVQYILPVITNILQYASPVSYSAAYAWMQLSPTLRKVYFLNPLTSLLEAFRWSILNTKPVDAHLLIWSVGISVVAMWIGAVSFKQMERKFADVI